MTTPINPDTIEDEVEAAPIENLLGLVRAEADLLADSLDIARSVQWEAPRPLPTENGQPANPTADVATDAERLALRLQIIRSERLLREAVISLRGVRLGLDRALKPYGGEDE